jgi:hypothetical protein
MLATPSTSRVILRPELRQLTFSGAMPARSASAWSSVPVGYAVSTICSSSCASFRDQSSGDSAIKCGCDVTPGSGGGCSRLTPHRTDIVHERRAPGAIEQLIAETAARDGRVVRIFVEQEPGAAGKDAASRYTSQVLRGLPVHPRRVTGEKAVRARPVAAAAENGLIRPVRGRHTSAFLDELSSFPHGRHEAGVLVCGHRNSLSKVNEESPTRGRLALATWGSGDDSIRRDSLRRLRTHLGVAPRHSASTSTPPAPSRTRSARISST